MKVIATVVFEDTISYSPEDAETLRQMFHDAFSDIVESVSNPDVTSTVIVTVHDNTTGGND